jgi:hypothetical protein
MDLLFIPKLIVVLLFLIMFLRQSRVVWGIGLITVTTAFLLDTVFGTFGRETVLAELGFFFYVISGSLFGGAALWLWGIMHTRVTGETEATARRPRPVTGGESAASAAALVAVEEAADSPFDRQMLYEQIRYRLSAADVMDLIFDLELNENDVVMPHQNMNHTILRLMDLAEQEGKMGALALAVERILTPIPPENLPRREKLGLDSPPTVLRHYLLAHYTQDELAQLAAALDVDWEQLGSNKKELVRGFLLYLMQRNRLDELIALLQQPESLSEVE